MLTGQELTREGEKLKHLLNNQSHYSVEKYHTQSNARKDHPRKKKYEEVKDIEKKYNSVDKVKFMVTII